MRALSCTTVVLFYLSVVLAGPRFPLPEPQIQRPRHIVHRSEAETQEQKSVFAQFIVSNAFSYQKQDWRRDIQLASGSGFDGFSLVVGEGIGGWQAGRIADAFSAAQELKGGFKLFFAFDFSVLPCSSMANLASPSSYIQQYKFHPNYFSYGSKPVVSSQSGEQCTFGSSSPKLGWSHLDDQLSSVFFIPGFLGDALTLLAGGLLDIVDGGFNYDSAWPVSVTTANLNASLLAVGSSDSNPHYAPVGSPAEQLLTKLFHSTYSDRQYVDALNFSSKSANSKNRKLYMAAVSPWYFTHFNTTPPPPLSSSSSSSKPTSTSTSGSGSLAPSTSSSSPSSGPTGSTSISGSTSGSGSSGSLSSSSTPTSTTTPTTTTSTSTSSSTSPSTSGSGSSSATSSGSTTSTSTSTTSTSTSTSTISTTSPTSTTSGSQSPLSPTVPAVARWSYLGCLTNDASNPTLTTLSTNIANLTVQKCVSTCDARGLPLAGLSSGVCYCSFFIELGTISSNKCSAPCPGDASQRCGGSASGSGDGSIDVFLATGDGRTLSPPTSGGSGIPNIDGWSHIGCISSISFLTNDFFIDLTLESCVAHCSTTGGGFAYAFAQNFNCLCGNTPPTSSPAGTTCNVACPGDVLEPCGGESGLANAYTAFARQVGGGGGSGGGLVVPNVPRWSYFGCYTDNPNAHALTIYEADSSTLTVESCVSTCDGKGYPLAGVQDTHCYCSTFLSSGSTPTSGGCDHPCPGDNKEPCGGSAAVGVFLAVGSGGTSTTATSTSSAGGSSPTPGTVPTIDGWTYLGCISSIYFITNDFFIDLTLESCTETCKNGGFIYAIAQNFNCLCGNILPGDATPRPAGTCNIACPGNTFEVCGGLDQTGQMGSYTVYGQTQLLPPPSPSSSTTTTTTSSSASSSPTAGVPFINGWGSVGCFLTSGYPTSADQTTTLQSPTLESCTTFCAGQGVPYSGASGSFCYCSTTFDPNTATSSNGCNIPCDANHDEFCGGSDSVTVYVKQGQHRRDVKRDNFAIDPVDLDQAVYLSDLWYPNRWDTIISNRSQIDFVQVVSWNHYGQSSYVGPLGPGFELGVGWASGKDHTGWLQLTKYYAQAYKTGFYPTIVNDQIFIWARSHPRDANVPDPVGKPLNYQLLQDSAFVVILAKAPGIAELSTAADGSNTSTFNITSIGASYLSIPLTVGGTLSAVMSRGGKIVARATASPPTYLYTQNPGMYNFNPLVVGSTTSWEG